MVSINSPATRPLDLPLVSVIVSAYNYGHFIGQTLESLQAQTYQYWECVVVDDGSTDDTAQVVARYTEKDSRIKYMWQKNRGPSAARNNGLMKTSGQFVQFLDADDLIESEKFERQVEYLEQYTEVDIVYGNMRYFDFENMNKRRYTMWGEDKPWMPETSGTGKEILTALIHKNILVINSPLIRRSVIDEVGLFDKTLKGPEDWDYWLRCAAQGKYFQYQELKGTLALVRSHSSSISKNREGMIRQVLRMRKKLAKTLVEDNLRQLNERYLQIEREYIVERMVTEGVEKITHGNTIAGAEQLCKAGAASGEIAHGIKWIMCAFLSLILPKQLFRQFALILLHDSLERILLYKAKGLFLRLHK